MIVEHVLFMITHGNGNSGGVTFFNIAMAGYNVNFYIVKSIGLGFDHKIH